jgi:hypothetical protein
MAESAKIGRDAKTGEFIPVKDALGRPNTTVVETIKRSPPIKQSDSGPGSLGPEFLFPSL